MQVFESHYENLMSEFVYNYSVESIAAADGDLDILIDVLQKSESKAVAKDENGWEPIHEAVRGGHVDAVQVLIVYGADIHQGESSLTLSLEEHGHDHPMTVFLKSQGASE